MIGRDFRRALINNIGVQTTDVRSQYDALLQDNTIGACVVHCDIHLKDFFADLQRLSQICLQSHIPSAYRLLVWKLLLGVLPPIRSAWEFVERQESEQYADLSKAVPLLVSAADLSRSPAYPIVAAFLVKSNMTRRIPRVRALFMSLYVILTSCLLRCFSLGLGAVCPARPPGDDRERIPPLDRERARGILAFLLLCALAKPYCLSYKRRAGALLSRSLCAPSRPPSSTRTANATTWPRCSRTCRRMTRRSCGICRTSAFRLTALPCRGLRHIFATRCPCTQLTAFSTF